MLYIYFCSEACIIYNEEGVLLLYISIIALVFIFDRVTKSYINKNYKIGQTKEIVKDKIYLYHLENEGAAYGLLADKPRILKLLSFSSIIMLSIYAFNIFKENSCKAEKSFTAMIIGGAIGNLYDRFRNKSVTDFMYVKYKKAPVFNIADVFIFIGSIGTFILSLRKGK